MVLSDSSDEEEQRQPKKTTKSAPVHTLSDDEDFTTQVSVVLYGNVADYWIFFLQLHEFCSYFAVVADPDPHGSASK